MNNFFEKCSLHKLAAGGKPSTRFPPEGLVELIQKKYLSKFDSITQIIRLEKLRVLRRAQSEKMNNFTVQLIIFSSRIAYINSDRAIFSVFRRTAEQPLYRIENRPKLRNKQGEYAVIGMDGQILKRGHDLKTVLRVLERKLIRIVR